VPLTLKASADNASAIRGIRESNNLSDDRNVRAGRRRGLDEVR